MPISCGDSTPRSRRRNYSLLADPCSSCRLDDRVNFLSMVGNYGIQFLLDLAQDARWVDSWKVPVDVLVDDFNQRKKFCK